MAAIKLDKPIVAFVRKLSGDTRFGDGTMTSIVRNAVLYFAAKHEKCFPCEFHKDQVAGLELGRQQMALRDYSNKTAAADVGEWVVLDEDTKRRATLMAACHHRPMKNIVEQALLEHLTRPPNCSTCPFYAEMRSTVGGEKTI